MIRDLKETSSLVGVCGKIVVAVKFCAVNHTTLQIVYVPHKGNERSVGGEKVKSYFSFDIDN